VDRAGGFAGNDVDTDRQTDRRYSAVATTLHVPAHILRAHNLISPFVFPPDSVQSALLVCSVRGLPSSVEVKVAETQTTELGCGKDDPTSLVRLSLVCAKCSVQPGLKGAEV
jgi:hypothetical protein